MARRVIYIKNPKDGGSHFRTISGNGGGTTTRPKSQLNPQGIPNRNGYLPGRTAPGSWAVNNPSNPANPWINPYGGQDFGTPAGGSVGPFELQFTPAWETPESLLGQLLIIAQGYDPISGQPSPRFGEPGYHSYNPLSGKHKFPFGPARPAVPLNRKPLWYPFD